MLLLQNQPKRTAKLAVIPIGIDHGVNAKPMKEAPVTSERRNGKIEGSTIVYRCSGDASWMVVQSISRTFVCRPVTTGAR